MPGKIEKQVLMILASEPHNAFTTEDLCERVYGANEKRHHVAMLRVMKRIAGAGAGRYRLKVANRRGRELVLYDATDIESTATAGIKRDTCAAYRGKGFARDRFCKGRRLGVEEAEAEVRARLAENERVASQVREGGYYWRSVEKARAEIAGDTQKVAEMEAEDEAGLAAFREQFKALAPLFAARKRGPYRKRNR